MTQLQACSRQIDPTLTEEKDKKSECHPNRLDDKVTVHPSVKPVPQILQVKWSIKDSLVDAFPSLPPSILKSISRQEPDIRMLKDYLGRCPNPKLVFDAIQMRRLAFETRMLYQKKQKIRLMELGTSHDPQDLASVANKLRRYRRHLRTLDYIRQQLRSYGDAVDAHDGVPHVVQATTKDATHPTTTDAGHPTTTDAGHPTTTDAGHPTTTDAGHPTTTDVGHPTTTDAGHPSTTPMVDASRPLLLEQAIANGSFLSTYRIDEFTMGRSDAEKAAVLRKVIVDIEHRLRHDRSSGLSHRSKKLKMLLSTFKDRYKLSQTSRGIPENKPVQGRIPNRFTKISYATLEEEIAGVKEWRNTEKKTMRNAFARYTRVMRHNSAVKGSESRATIKRQYETSLLKYQTVSKYLERLNKEVARGANLCEQVDTQSVSDQVESSTPDLSEGANEQLPIEPLYTPYNVQHYVLGNILDQFKEAMYLFGRREFRVHMESRGWSSPESIPVTEFMSVMTTDPDIRDRYKFFEHEFQSLRRIRNAYAHSVVSMTITETHTLLRDMRTVASALRFSTMVPRIEEYLDVLASFEHNYQKAQAEVREKGLAKLRRLRLERDTASKRIDGKISEIQRQLQDLESQKRTIQSSFEKGSLDVRQKWGRVDRQVGSQLSQDLAAFALEEHIRRSLRAMPTPRATSLVQRLFADHASGSAVSLDANTGAGSAQVSEASPLPSASDTALGMPSSDAKLKDSYLAPSLVTTSAADIPIKMPPPAVEEPRELRQGVKETAFPYQKFEPQTVKLADIDDSNEIDVNQDPSFRFLQVENLLDQSQDVALDKPSAPANDLSQSGEACDAGLKTKLLSVNGLRASTRQNKFKPKVEIAQSEQLSFSTDSKGSKTITRRWHEKALRLEHRHRASRTRPGFGNSRGLHHSLLSVQKYGTSSSSGELAGCPSR
ncbi:uncharacterized protein K460DRAFT_407194 [Cucurbitaria berberidis CBS 394.84]|uniref:Uncharacterized protein n=1 Tax=Cucurbitaria berberidis CBS 394.84 TaxID=1168544 RepID=A0A9P4L5L6_9PLEO|nr:uncharacterized protein K460DRAFT_407194 [Cucurbitaria berberidis CBS 394.84]KAF1842810.1 hypothetical protein K460DRAFT_407194 [Cucurbitaria berberidis CBS 394.84]